MSSNESIKAAIRKIVEVSHMKAVEFLDCYVTHVYPEGDEDYGSIDVKTIKEQQEIKGVSLSALPENERGEIKIPTLLSEVTVALVNGGVGYVVEYSHIDKQIIDVNNSIKVGATGYEAPTNDEDYDETDPTGFSSSTEHTPESIQDRVLDENNNKANTLNKTIDSSVSTLEDGSTSKSSTVTQTPINIKLDVGGSYMEQTEQQTNVVSNKIVLGQEAAAQNAVLGAALKTFMTAFVDQVATITVTTSMGPQPILNAASVLALKSQVDTFLSQTNFFQ